MHCLASSKQTCQIDLLLLQFRKEALPKLTQLGSGRVEIKLGLQVHLTGLYWFTSWKLCKDSF